MSSSLPHLNDDVLLHIFDLNTDMFNDKDTLRTARITSQVCRHWRNMMLGTPSLWAKLVDMDEISLIWNGNWRKELIRRSGDAPLWIRSENTSPNNGPRGAYGKNMQKFFEEVITKNWHRIEKLVLSHKSAFKLTRSMICSPAPLLKHIEAAVPPFPDLSEPLFANQAPMLCNIYLGNNAVDHRAPWLYHLHSIRLDNSYDLPNSLAILSATRHLQELRFTNIASGSVDAALPSVSLMHLQSLTYSGNGPNMWIALRDHITIPANCALSISLDNSADNSIHPDQKSLILSTFENFMQHAESFVKSHTLTGIHLDYTPKNTLAWGCKAKFPVTVSLSISVPLNDDYESSILELFLMKLSEMDFQSPTCLKITAHGDSISPFAPFFGHLASVDTLFADTLTLCRLAQWQHSINSQDAGARNVVFPLLTVVKIFDHGEVLQESCYINAMAGTFLLSRFRADLPITTLDMSLIRPLEDLPFLQVFEQFNCSTVLYRLEGTEGVIRYKCRASKK